MFWVSLSAQGRNSSSCHLWWTAVGGSYWPWAQWGKWGGRQKSVHNWNILNNWIWIIVWRVQFIFWEFRFGTLLPHVLVMLLWGWGGNIMLLVCCPLEPMSWMLSFTCLSWGWGEGVGLYVEGMMNWLSLLPRTLGSPWCLRKSPSPREGYLFMMEDHSLIPAWKGVWTD